MRRRDHTPRPHKVLWLWAGLLGGGILAAALTFGYLMTGPADRTPTHAESISANLMRRLFIPLRVSKVPAAPATSTESLLAGRKIFLQACSTCHAATGHGDQQLAGSFYPPVPDITGEAAQRWSDRELFWIIRNGIRLTGMPAWRSTLSEQQTWDVVSYVRHLSIGISDARTRSKEAGNSPKDLRDLALETIDDEGCRDCHTIDGRGAKRGPNLSDEWARRRSDEWLLGHFKNPKAYTPGTPMPSFSHLSDMQLKALVFFLQQPE